MMTNTYYRALIALAFLLFIGTAYGQKAQKIEGIAKESKSISYYKEQSDLWKSEIDKLAKDGHAWVQYYKANRARYQLELPKLWSEDRPAFYSKLDPIITDARAAMGNSYEYYLIQGLNSEGTKSIEALENAYRLDPLRPETHGWLLSYYIPRFDTERCASLSEIMLKSNAYSNASLMWNHNALMSCEPDALLIVNGDMDGIPKYVLQYGKNVRRDVLVVSKWFMGNMEDYRAEILARLGLPEPPKTESDFQTFVEYVDYLTSYLLQESKRPSYIMVGTPRQFFKTYDLEGHMYVVGNVLKYDAQGFDNTKTIAHNYEKVYQMEYLLENYQVHEQDQIVESSLNLSYLPALFTLKKFYMGNGNMPAHNRVNRYIETILAESGRAEEVREWFENY